MWKHTERRLGCVLTIVLMTIQSVKMEGSQTRRPKIDLTKPMNVDYVLKYIATYVPQVWSYNDHGMLKEDANEDATQSSEPPSPQGDLGEKPSAVGGGPGWVEIHVPWPPLDQPLEYVLSYKPRGARHFFQAAPVRYTRAWTHAAAVAEAGPLAAEPLPTPLMPCPAWVRRGYFCLVVSDHIQAGHRFRDYEAKLTIRGINYLKNEDSKSCKSKKPTKGKKDPCKTAQKNDEGKLTSNMQEKNLTYLFSFRVWNCDPTISSFDCSDIGAELDLSLYVPELRAGVHMPLVDVDVPMRWLRVMRRLWPVTLMLLLLLVCVGMPVVFVRAKRAGERAALQEIFLREQDLLARMAPPPEARRSGRGAGALVVPVAVPAAPARTDEPPAKKWREW